MLQRDEVERFHGFAIVVLFISVGGDGARAISKGAKWLESRFREHHLIVRVPWCLNVHDIGG